MWRTAEHEGSVTVCLVQALRGARNSGVRVDGTVIQRAIGYVESLQDETGGFQTYIPLSFHPDHSEMAHIPAPTAHDDLKSIAVARLFLDNIPHVKAYWIMLTIPVAQLALSWGADDVDGTVVEERIYHDAGATTPQRVARQELLTWIREAGRIPVERDTLYNVVWSADEDLAPVGSAAPVLS